MDKLKIAQIPYNGCRAKKIALQIKVLYSRGGSNLACITLLWPQSKIIDRIWFGNPVPHLNMTLTWSWRSYHCRPEYPGCCLTSWKSKKVCMQKPGIENKLKLLRHIWNNRFSLNQIHLKDKISNYLLPLHSCEDWITNEKISSAKKTLSLTRPHAGTLSSPAFNIAAHQEAAEYLGNIWRS